jgi:hypothetical protein
MRKKNFITLTLLVAFLIACAPSQNDRSVQNPIFFGEKWRIYAEFKGKKFNYDFLMVEKPYVPNPRNPETYAEIRAGELKGQLFQYEDFGINIRIFFNSNVKIDREGPGLENFDLVKTEPALWCYVRVDWNTETNKYKFNGRSWVGTLNTDSDLEQEDGCRLEKIN